MIYSAKFWDAEYNLISNEKIWMMATGKPWEVQPDRQMELLIQYTYDEDELKVLENHQVNQA